MFVHFKIINIQNY